MQENNNSQNNNLETPAIKKSISISIKDGIVIGINSPILFELRNLDRGFKAFTSEEIEKAKMENRALITIFKAHCQSVFLPQGIVMEVAGTCHRGFSKPSLLFT